MMNQHVSSARADASRRTSAKSRPQARGGQAALGAEPAEARLRAQMFVLLDHEDAGECRAFEEALRTELASDSALQEIPVAPIAVAAWRMRRVDQLCRSKPAIERPGVLEAVDADQPDVGVRLGTFVPFALAGAHPLARVAPALIVVLGIVRRMEADPRPRAQTVQHVPADESRRPRAVRATGHQVVPVGHLVPRYVCHPWMEHGS